MNEYEQNVEEAKGLLNKINLFQLKIAKLAVQVCDIRHGGRSNDIYTLKRFANDIGLKQKTLSNWVAIYRRVVLKLNKEIETDKEWSNASKTYNIMRKELCYENWKDKRAKCLADPDKVRSDNDVQKLYDDIEEKPFIEEFFKMISAAKNIKYKVGIRDLSIVEEGQLIYLMSLLDESSDMINDHLTLMRKKMKV